MTETLDLDRLRHASWLKTPTVRRVFAALAGTGAVSRAVGGAVRNTLLGEPIDDIDIATAATPDQVLLAAERAGLRVIATGLQHGTVTLIADGTPFEVTTLRRDVTTDGRHASVAFTDDWALDASRRDFTINALYSDADGTLFDPLGGCVDLMPTRIRFIGDARARIREDYLRIMRFFRFSARYDAGAFDRDGLDACSAERDGLVRVSAERIRAELFKLLLARRAAEACRTMQSTGFLVAMLGCAPSPLRLERLTEIEAALRLPADPVRRLAALALHPCGDAALLARRLRLSRDERQRLHTIAATWAAGQMLVTSADAKRAIYRQGANGFRDALLVAWAGGSAATDDSSRRNLAVLADTWAAPKLPVTGADVLALGVGGGPKVGVLMAAVESWWLAHDFAPDRQACLDEIAARIRSPKT